jgi:hypothetical protein
MIEWLVSEYVDDDGTPVVSQWFDEKCRKNKAFRHLQNRLETRINAIREGGPDLVVSDSGISPHVDKIRISGRLTIRVLLMRGPTANEVTLIGASIEKDRALIEPGIEERARQRQRELASGRGNRKEYVYIPQLHS